MSDGRTCQTCGQDRDAVWTPPEASECGKASGYHDDGDPMLCTLPEDHSHDHAHHGMFTWPEWASAYELSESLPVVGTRLRFDGKRTSWLVRAHAGMGRYSLCTASFGMHGVAYTIVDWHEKIRGPLNIVGGGLDIFTTNGPDPAIDRAVLMLDEGVECEIEAASEGSTASGQWGVSHRNSVRLAYEPPADRSGAARETEA